MIRDKIAKIWRSTMGKLLSKKKPDCELTPEEVAAIREVWIKAKNDDVGKKILAALIERRPKFAEYFGIASETINVKELYTNRQFQLQAHRIQGFLDTAVGSLGYCPLTSIYDMAHRIGQIHFYRGVNFGADNWLVFKKVAVDQVTLARSQSKSASSVDMDDRQSQSVEDPANPFTSENCIARVGWNKLMGVIVREMKRGFLEEAMRNCKEEDVENPLSA
ncbi:hypothetical protein QR680_017983 [Steinernema hermaphroditum]|uniref:Globin domain-containing protein n=1 Tax=Steinernema hermaphroditum TaxID=289476 RepID=A0AA39HHG0_9BILA|nr:hypothetical protein QR680_017983 [Steinernema hermaphroditum]